MNKSNSPAVWLTRCRELGWNVSKKAGLDVAVSPRSTVISYDPKTRKWTSGVCKSDDFTKLVNLMIDSFGKTTHEYRKTLIGSKLDTKELFALLDVCRPPEKPTPVDDWKVSDDGKWHLDYFVGPLGVSATVNEDYSWTVALTDGGPCDRADNGKSEDITAAKLAINELLMEWGEEVVVTGRYAMRLVSKLKGVVE